MLCFGIKTLRKAVLLAVVSLALVATGFAHRLASSESQAQKLALAGGFAAADLCGGESRSNTHAGPQCLACRIAATADLPRAATDLQDLDPVFLARISAPRESRLILSVLDPAHSPQGPPAG